MQGAIAIVQFEGFARANVAGIGNFVLKKGGVICMPAWPVGLDYPVGKRYMMALSDDDTRAEHSVQCSGPREALVLVYDRFPSRKKERFTTDPNPSI